MCMCVRAAKGTFACAHIDCAISTSSLIIIILILVIGDKVTSVTYIKDTKWLLHIHSHNAHMIQAQTSDVVYIKYPIEHTATSFCLNLQLVCRPNNHSLNAVDFSTYSARTWAPMRVIQIRLSSVVVVVCVSLTSYTHIVPLNRTFFSVSFYCEYIFLFSPGFSFFIYLLCIQKKKPFCSSCWQQFEICAWSLMEQKYEKKSEQTK